MILRFGDEIHVFDARAEDDPENAVKKAEVPRRPWLHAAPRKKGMFFQNLGSSIHSSPGHEITRFPVMENNSTAQNMEIFSWSGPWRKRVG